MATSRFQFMKRLNVYSNPRIGTGTVETEDNARVLRYSMPFKLYI